MTALSTEHSLHLQISEATSEIIHRLHSKIAMQSGLEQINYQDIVLAGLKILDLQLEGRHRNIALELVRHTQSKSNQVMRVKNKM